MSLPDKHSQIPGVRELYHELNYPQGSLYYPEFRTATLTFVQNYRTRDGRPAKEFIMLSKPEKLNTERVFTDMATSFVTSGKKGPYFWPSDPTSTRFNSLQFSTNSDIARILSSIMKLFFRMSYNQHSYDKLRKDSGADSFDSQSEEDYLHDMFGEPRARSSGALSPDPASDNLSMSYSFSSFQAINAQEPPLFGQTDTNPPNNTTVQDVTKDSNGPNSGMVPPCSHVVPSQVFGPPSDASSTPSGTTRPHPEGDDKEESSAKRVKEQRPPTPKRKTTYGKAPAGASISPQPVRHSSRTRTPRTWPDGILPEAEADEILQAAERSDSEPHQSQTGERADQPAAPKPLLTTSEAVIPIAPVAPMGLPQPEQSEAGKNKPEQSRAKPSVNITTWVIFSIGKINKKVQWEPETSVPRMALSRLEEQVARLTDVNTSGLTPKGLRLTLETPQGHFEQVVYRGKEAQFGEWKMDCSRAIKKGITQLKNGESLPVKIRIEALVEGGEAHMEADDDFGVEDWC